jgi:hypothetical protein
MRSHCHAPRILQQASLTPGVQCHGLSARRAQ